VAIKQRVRGIRGSLPAGTLVGRLAGKGAPQLIRMTDLQAQFAAGQGSSTPNTAITGTLTAPKVPVASGAHTLINSSISDDGTKVTISEGLVVGSPTGGNEGAGTVNAVNFYINGTLLTADNLLGLASTGLVKRTGANTYTVDATPLAVGEGGTGVATANANVVFSGPTSGAAAAPGFRALVGADLPNPSASTLGGVESLAAVSHKWINTISTSGVPSATQPASTDLSDLPIPVSSGGTGLSSTSQNFVFVGPTSGSGAPTWRLLVGGDLPNPSASTLGGVESLAASSHKWINTISTSGVPSATQPASTDLSDIPIPVSSGGTGLASGTSGGILGYTASGTLASSTALAANNLVIGGGAGATPSTEADWKVSSHNLIMNQNAASAPAVFNQGLQLCAADSTPVALQLNAFAAASFVYGVRADGTAASPTHIGSGEGMFRMGGRAYDGSTYSSSTSPEIFFIAGETWGTTAHGGYVQFSAMQNGTTTQSPVCIAKAAADGGTQMLGTSAGDNASAGWVGEYVSSVVLIASEVTLTSTVLSNITSVSLTAGDYDVWAETWFDVGGTTTVSHVECSINTSNSAHPTVPADGTAVARMYPASTTGQELVVPITACRVNPSSTTSYYMNVTASFATSTLKAYGKLCARRRR
jgi:hypothetical protein